MFLRLLFVFFVITNSFASPQLEWNQYRNARIESSYGLPSSLTPTVPTAANAYPPSGWKPQGPTFTLPNEVPKTTETAELTTEIPSKFSSSPGIRDEETGQYFVVLPNGLIQKVRYSTKQRGRGQYEAQVEFEDVEPIRPPIYRTLPVEFFK